MIGPKPVAMTHIPHSYTDHRRAILKLGLPLIASNMAQFAIQMTDTIMLGWYDVAALAAATIATTLFFVVFIMGSGFAFAVTPLVAAAAEAGDETQVRRVTRMGIWLSVIYGFVFTLPFLWAEPILIAMGQEPSVAALAQDYLQIVAWQMVPALLVMTLKSYLAALRAYGRDPVGDDRHRADERGGQLCADLRQLGRARDGHRGGGELRRCW